jgi:hypothetical protein
MRSAPMVQNSYYEFFRDSMGKGNNLYYSGIGDIYSSVPQFRRGYGILTRRSGFASRARLGYGFRSWFSNLFRFAKPMLKRGLNEVGRPLLTQGIKEVADIASKVASDTLEGVSFKDSLKQRTSQKAAELIEKSPAAFSGLIRKTKGSGINARSSVSRSAVRRSINQQPRKNYSLNQVLNSKRKKKKTPDFHYPALKLIG